MNDCGSVSMDLYWNYIGTPLFFGVLGFGGVALLSMGSVQLVSNDIINKAVSQLDLPTKLTVETTRKDTKKAEAALKPSAPPAPKPTK
jgi:hypothetical protein